MDKLARPRFALRYDLHYPPSTSSSHSIHLQRWRRWWWCSFIFLPSRHEFTFTFHPIVPLCWLCSYPWMNSVLQNANDLCYITVPLNHNRSRCKCCRWLQSLSTQAHMYYLMLGIPPTHQNRIKVQVSIAIGWWQRTMHTLRFDISDVFLHLISLYFGFKYNYYNGSEELNLRRTSKTN